jgi:dTDP-4-dehydrorhamnose reductase
MKIVLIGKNGQLGSDCWEVLRGDHELVALGSRELDITQAPQVEAMVRQERPELVLNCAAYTKVDACEQERDLAYAINVAGPRHLAASLARQGGRLLHISTDYVFDGRKPVPTPYREDDPVAPLSYYAQTKAAAEEAIRQEMDDYMIVRTAWMYGRRGHNFLKTMLRLALQEPPVPIRVVNDQFGSPTWSYRLAQQLAALIAAGGQGIYHATAEGYTTWHGLATTFFQIMGLDISVTPITTAEYPTPARRPQNSILENQRLKDQGLNLMRPWQDDLQEFVSLYREALYQEIRGT